MQTTNKPEIQISDSQSEPLTTKHNSIISKELTHKLLAYSILISFFILFIPISLRILKYLRTWSSNTLFFVLYLNIICITVYLLIFFIIYHFELFLEYKESDKPQPWHQRIDYWDKLLGLSCKYTFINGFVTPLVITLIITYGKFINTEVEENQIPNVKQLISQIFICYLISEFCYCYLHKLMHSHYFFKLFHRIQHKYLMNISLTTFHQHPIDFIVTYIIPAIVGPIIIIKFNTFHEVTLWCWIIIYTGFKIDSFSGFNLSFSPFRIIPFYPSYSGLNNTSHFIERTKFFSGYLRGVAKPKKHAVKKVESD